jgi:Catalytic LigB subunit of aromatic ring-opening dioxygenase
MPLVYAQALSYSPMLYRPLEAWPELHAHLVGDVVQPLAASAETSNRLVEVWHAVDDAFKRAAERIIAARLDALVLLYSDENRIFNLSNTPQMHVFTGNEIWGDPALVALGERPARTTFACAGPLAAVIAEELVVRGFDISEGKAFTPRGDAERGAGGSVVEPLTRLGIAGSLPIIPIHINAHVAPALTGRRAAAFGTALADALALVPERVGILASGGLSGNPGGRMAGWIDDVLDTWVLRRLTTGRAVDLGSIFEVASMALAGSTAEIRLWAATGSAMERNGARAHLGYYQPLYHAAVGTAFMHWEAQ